MFKFAAVTLSLLALVSSSQAWASDSDAPLTVTASTFDLFSFKSTDAGISYSWTLPSTLTVDSTLASLGTGFVVDLSNQNVTPSGNASPLNLIAFTSSNNNQTPVFYDVANSATLYTGSQVYSNTETSPTFILGKYTGEYDVPSCAVYCSGTLTISQIAAVPEPETYGMMLAGLGLMGFMVRRKNSV